MIREKKQLSRENINDSKILKNDEQFKYIYGMLSKQEDTIGALLEKYRNEEKQIQLNIHEKSLKNRSQSIDTSLLPTNVRFKKILPEKNKLRKNSYLGPQIKQQSFDEIRYSNRSSVLFPAVGKQQNKYRNPNARNISRSQKKYKLQDKFHKIYGDPSQVNIVSFQHKRAQPKKLNIGITKKLEPITPFQMLELSPFCKETGHHHLNHKEEKCLQEQINQNYQIQSNDSSNSEGMDSMHYERQFRQKLKGQCTQEINFLYFSKNDAMNDWTQGLLCILERHDKEITSLRVKSKYLSNFDDRFWSIGIFNTEQI